MTGYAYSMNEEDYHGGTFDSVEAAIAESVDMICAELYLGDGSIETGTLYVGEATHWDEERIGALMFNAITDWDILEDRVGEMFYEETLAEDASISWPQGQQRTEYFEDLKNFMLEMAKKYGIKAPWFSVNDPIAISWTAQEQNSQSGVIEFDYNGQKLSYGFDL